jgi:uncharacterized surface protein with fasciclin (FAS1) repeats
MKRMFLKLAAVAVVGTIVSACGGDDDPAPAPTGTIVEVAQGSGLSTLVTAAKAASLDDDLSAASTAGLTVFAPTNAAFETLAKSLGFTDAPDMVAKLPADSLAKILSYHVLPAKKVAADLGSAPTQNTIYQFESAPATVGVSTTGGVTITDGAKAAAKVTKADVIATNGVVHVIDRVLVPPGVLNVVQMAQSNPAFSSLVGAVVKADLATTLSGAGPFTVFAPTDAAFTAAKAVVDALSVAQLGTVLKYHVLGTQVLSKDIVFPTTTPTVAGPTITINGTGLSDATIADSTTTAAKITAVDVRASNGVIHVIDKVLQPPASN